MADRYNEGKALDAVLRFIEARDMRPRKTMAGRQTTRMIRTSCGESTTFAWSAKRSMPSSTRVSNPSKTKSR